MTREYDFLTGYSFAVIGGGLGFVIGGVLGHVRARKAGKDQPASGPCPRASTWQRSRGIRATSDFGLRGTQHSICA